MENVLKVIFSESFLFTIVRVGVPLMFAALSAYVASLSGMPNIAIEGIMLFSALMAVMGSYWTQNAWLGLLIAVATGLVLALVIAGLTMKLGTMPVLVGIALNTFAASFTVFLLYMFTGSKGSTSSIASKVLPTVNIPLIEDIPI
ncbi:MAG: ABC transporter permease, partial [Oscillospiraceae bacterium]|nr:ABC transporter permease [Oscillospiraceae bacterium]